MPLLGSLKHQGDRSGKAVELLKANVTPFPSINESEAAFSQTFDSFGNCKVLLIGDASHGTSEFYAARAKITQYMIEHHGFNVVAVEADWPDAEMVDRYVRRRPGPVADIEAAYESKRKGREPAFMRFPTWMWRNQEMQHFVEWLRGYNGGRAAQEAISFSGLDLYSLRTSMQAVIDYLDHVDPDMADLARERYGQLMLWADQPQAYGLEASRNRLEGYEREVLQMLQDLLRKRLEYAVAHWDGEEFHSSEQNARLVVGK